MDVSEKAAFLAVAKLGSPWGLEGELRIYSYSGEFDHIFHAPEILIAGVEGLADAKPAKILRHSEHGGVFCILIEGYASPEKAKTLSGREIFLPRTYACPLQTNEYYIADLVGLSVVLEGNAIGVVKAVCDGNADELLEIALNESDRTVLVPFRKEFIGIVDTNKGQIEILAPWILE